MRAKGLENILGGAIARFIDANMPKWLWMIVLRKMVAYRPQVSFLSHVEDTGSTRPSAQPSLIRTRILLEMLAKVPQKVLSPLPSSTTTVDPVAI